MKYTVYSTVWENGMIMQEDIMLETENAEEAKKCARDIAARDQLEQHPERFTVEIRYNEDFERGTYEALDF